MPLRQVETLTESLLADLHSLYQREWWSQGRSLDDVRQMVQHTSLIVGFVGDDGKLAAFARVLTDYVFHALVYDVIVAESLRGQGLGRELMNALLDHPRLKQVSAVWLCCLPELVPFYENWGFELCGEPLQWMVKVQRAGWTKPASNPVEAS